MRSPSRLSSSASVVDHRLRDVGDAARSRRPCRRRACSSRPRSRTCCRSRARGARSGSTAPSGSRRGCAPGGSPRSATARPCPTSGPSVARYASKTGPIGISAKRMPRRSARSSRVAQAALRGVRAGHGDAEDALGAERLGRERRRDGRVDAAREAEDGAREAALARVVGEREDERAAQARDRRLRAAATGPRPPGQVDRPEVLLEAPAGADEAAARVEGGRGAVEDEAVVAADEVAVHERHAACGARCAPSCAGAGGSCRACTARRRC